jgi:hypothetical protein
MSNRAKIIRDYLNSGSWSYIGDTEDLSCVCLDGWFDLEDLARRIEADTKREVAQKIKEASIHGLLGLSLPTDSDEEGSLIDECYSVIAGVCNMYLTQGDE